MASKTLFKLLFYVINLLFVYKYSLRQDFIPVYVVLAIFSLIYYVALTTNVFDFAFFTPKNLKILYVFTTIALTFVLFFIIHNADGNALNVDRWSAMEVGIKSVLNGQYPYSATDHLNQYTSNLPSLFLIGMPFYWLGNVGYLQIFTFLLLNVTLYHYFGVKKTLYFQLFLVISPAFWWEIFCLSDLMSNLFLLLCFFIFIERKLGKDKFKHPVVLGLVLGFFTLTRGIVVAPLALYYFADFWKISWVQKIKFALAYLVTVALLIAFVLHNCPDLETLQNYHPLRLQTILLPNYIVVLSLAIPFVLSFYVKKFYNDFLVATVLCMLFPVVIAFGIRWYDNSFHEIITRVFFDLSYLSMCFPFLIMVLVLQKKNSVTA